MRELGLNLSVQFWIPRCLALPSATSLQSSLDKIRGLGWSESLLWCHWPLTVWFQQAHSSDAAFSLLSLSSLIGETGLLTVNENQDLYRKRSLIYYRVILACNVPVCSQTQPDSLERDWEGSHWLLGSRLRNAKLRRIKDSRRLFFRVSWNCSPRCQQML